MVPSIANVDFRVRVLDFQPLESERDLIVYRNTKIECVTYPRVPGILRTGMIYDEIENFEPDIVHHFYHECSFAIAFFIRTAVANPPRYLIDIRSPLIDPDELTVQREIARNRMTSPYCDVITTDVIESAQMLAPDNGAKITQTLPGVSTETFKFKELSTPSPLFRFVYIGSLAPDRNLGQLLHFFTALHRRTGPTVTLDIFGEGRSRRELEIGVERSGLSRTIRFHGSLPQAQLGEELRKYDAGICYLPYEKFADAPALKFMEYAAAGLAIFASDTPGLRKLSEAGAHAEFFANNPDSFCAAIQPWITKPYPLAPLKENRRYAEARNWSKLVRRDYYPIYRRLADLAARSGEREG